jgi:hypothetical protein
VPYFAINPPNLQEPNIQIMTDATPAGSVLVDCTVAQWSTGAPPIFQFEQSFTPGFAPGPWTNTAVVTPGGHVFYGISTPPLASDGTSPSTVIRLQATPDSPNNGWQFWGCELTYVS